MERLAQAGIIQPALIVAIDNLEEHRFLQYMPQTIYDRAEGDLRTAIDQEIARTGDRPLVSAQFLRFLTTRLKPFVEARYRTLLGRLDTAIFGASMARVGRRHLRGGTASLLPRSVHVSELADL